MEQSKPSFDAERASAMLGKHVIIGLTYCDDVGTLLEQVQLHGDITEADEQQIVIRLSGSGEVFTLPPDLSAFVEAPPGEYRFRSTGEVVTDPDLMTQWTIQRPGPNEPNSQDGSAVLPQ
jgi:hypothetical protein